MRDSSGRRFGEIAFLLDQPRSADVYAATDRKLTVSDPAIVAQLLLNISKILCLRLLKST